MKYKFKRWCNMKYLNKSSKIKSKFISIVILMLVSCSIQNIQAQEFVNSQFIDHKPLTIDAVQKLILKAKEGDSYAQDELMRLYYQGSYAAFLEPEAIGFDTWKSQNLQENIQTRCYQNDVYAYY